MSDREDIIRSEYSELMQKSYIDYAMSVIIARALPDVRDGLKPVQRRTLYDMHELGIRWDRPYRKSARIVGDTMGKYHPHGDSSIYGALVVMAQDFKYGMPLVDGHGNFGSIEGDGAAAMRYTEARLQRLTQEAYLADLDKDIVDFIPNFDATEKEPSVLPVRIPNILINGAEGIAVGMATSIPPHNLSEVIEAEIALMKDPEITTEEILDIVEGPDFPTGGIVINKDELPEIYRTGNGKIKLRGRAHIEKLKNGRQAIVVTEIPYTMIGAGIGKFLNDVYALAESRKAPDISDISNQSSKEGIRIVIELRKGADAENILNLLYKKTRLEDTFGVNMLAVSGGRPETLGIVDILKQCVKFQFELCTRKYTTLLEKEKAKEEVQAGLIKACDVIDIIIEILRGSKSREQAQECLTEGKTEGIKFRSKESEKLAGELRFTTRQAEAILKMQLYRLIGLEVQALIGEHDKTLENISDYERILRSRTVMARVIISELKGIRDDFKKPRKTTVENASEAVYEEKPEEARPTVVLMDRFGYVKSLDPGNFEKNKESARDGAKFIIPCMSDDRLCVFTDKGHLHTAKVSSVPASRLKDKGVPIDNICNYDSADERIIFVDALANLASRRVLFVSKLGLVKTVDGVEFDVAKHTTAATKLADGDELVLVGTAGNGATLVLQSDKNFFLRFDAEDLPVQHKGAAGVRGMKLEDGESISAAWILGSEESPVAEVGGKAVKLNLLRIGKRGGRGTKR